MTTPKPLTPQKVRAVLRKAGCHASSLNRSKMIRGWVTRMPGYYVKQLTDGTIHVRYSHDLNPEAAARNLRTCFDVLAAYAPTMDTTNERIVIAPVVAAAAQSPTL